MEIEIYEVEPGRWGYRVDAVVQEWHPNKDGFVPMAMDEARENGEIILARMIQADGEDI